MNQSQQIIFDLELYLAGPLDEVKFDFGKITRKYRGIIGILRKKYGLSGREAVEQIMSILASGVDPDKLAVFFKQDIDRFFKGKALFDPITDVF